MASNLFANEVHYGLDQAIAPQRSFSSGFVSNLVSSSRNILWALSFICVSVNDLAAQDGATFGHSFINSNVKVNLDTTEQQISGLQFNLVYRAEGIFLEESERQMIKDLTATLNFLPCSEADARLQVQAVLTAEQIIRDRESLPNQYVKIDPAALSRLVLSRTRGFPPDPFLSDRTPIEASFTPDMVRRIARERLVAEEADRRALSEVLADVVAQREEYRKARTGAAGGFNLTLEREYHLASVSLYLERALQPRILDRMVAVNRELLRLNQTEDVLVVTACLHALANIVPEVPEKNYLLAFSHDFEFLIEQSWFQTWPTSTKKAVFEACYNLKLEHPDCRPIKDLDHLISNQQTLEQRNQTIALFADVKDPKTVKALLHYLSELVKTEKSEELFASDGAGGTLIDNLRKLAVAPLAAHLEVYRPELLEKCAMGLTSMKTLVQGDAGSCATMPVEAGLFEYFPPKAARILFGLASASGNFVTENGSVFYRKDPSENALGRDIVNRLMQDAFMEAANGHLKYDNSKDWHVDPETGKALSSGLSMDQSLFLMKAIFNQEFNGVNLNSDGLEKMMKALEGNSFPFACVTLKWNGGESSHMLMFLRIDHESGMVIVRNSHGYKGPVGTVLQDPLREVLDADLGIYAMPVEVFMKNLLFVITLPPSER